jgi:hypothetical protein
MDEPQSTGYWYSNGRIGRGVAVLNGLRDYRAAETAMRRRTRSAMRMGETDLLAIRFLLKAQGAGRIVSPKDLAAHLSIDSVRERSAIPAAADALNAPPPVPVEPGTPART